MSASYCIESQHSPKCWQAVWTARAHAMAYRVAWPHHCTYCDGWGFWGVLDPVDGVADPCPACAGRCPRCGTQRREEDGEPCERCGWACHEGVRVCWWGDCDCKATTVEEER